MIITTHCEAAIEADANVPIIRITRDFDATPDQMMTAHTDPALFRRWVGPEGMNTEIVARGRWSTVSTAATRGWLRAWSPA
jgi:uncharacterized protein YndB with AHSA1/START domain